MPFCHRTEHISILLILVFVVAVLVVVGGGASCRCCRHRVGAKIIVLQLFVHCFCGLAVVG